MLLSPDMHQTPAVASAIICFHFRISSVLLLSSKWRSDADMLSMKALVCISIIIII